MTNARDKNGRFRRKGASPGEPSADDSLPQPIPFRPRAVTERRPGELGLLLALVPLLVGITWAAVVYVKRRLD